MYQRKKLDMYMSVPISKEKRFAVIYLNGILAFLIPYLINLGLCFLVGQTMGADIFLGLPEAGCAIIGYSIFYLAVYHVTILAVMLTGNLIVTLMGTGVILFYDVAVLSLIMGYMDTFFSSYYYRSSENIDKFFVSPVSRFILMFDQCFTYEYRYTEERILHWEKFFSGILPVLLIAIVSIAVGYWCYTRKPSEVCGKAMAFPKTKGVIKILVTSVVGLAGGMMFYGLSGSSMAFMVLGLVTGTLLCHGAIEVIYDFDIRSVKKGWRSLLISGAIVTVFFSIFQFDIIGYDSYVPEASQVESLAFSFADNYDTFYTETLEAVGSEEYIFDNMEMTDIAPVLELAQLRMGMEEPDETEGSDAQYRSCIVKYELKNGKEVYRRFPTNYIEDIALLDTIVTDKAYQEATYLIYNEPFIALGNKLDFGYDSGAEQDKVTTFSLEELKAAYCKDLEGFTFTDMIEQRTQGRFNLECIADNNYVGGYLPVYPSFEHVNALLKEAGLYREHYVDVDEVEKVVIQNDNHELYEIYAEDEYAMHRDFMVEETFEKRDELEQIIPALYPDTYTEYWIPDGELNTGYYVTVIYKTGAEVHADMYVGYYMLEDKIPDFVRERTKYAE